MDGGQQIKSDEEAIMKYILLAIDKSGGFVLCLETFTMDHGGEVLSNAFQNWLEEQGIFHLTGPSSTPNDNAVIE